MKTMRQAVAGVNGEQLLEQIRELVGYVEQSCQAGRAVHEVGSNPVWSVSSGLPRCRRSFLPRPSGRPDP
jgi:hypothetical protein